MKERNKGKNTKENAKELMMLCKTTGRDQK